MIIQKVIKGIGGIDRSEAEKILEVGIQCNWWRKVGTLPAIEIPMRLTPENLYWHQNKYEDPDPNRSNQPFCEETPFISTTSGTVERIVKIEQDKTAIVTNLLHSAKEVALSFATDTWDKDGWLFYCYLFTLGKKAVQHQPFAEEIRELNIYTGPSYWQTEGEITAKIMIPPAQIEKAEFYSLNFINNQLDKKNIPSPHDTDIIKNELFVNPEDYHNIRGLAEEYF
jgi:hypothetical protein